MITTHHEQTTPEAEAWQDWADEQGDWQEAIERRRADAHRAEAEAINLENWKDN